MTRPPHPPEPCPPPAPSAAPPDARVGVAPSGARVRVVRPEDLSDREVDAWRRFQGLSPALESPYLCPEYVRLVASVRPGVAVAVAERGGETAGFFPFQRRGAVGKPVGGPLSDCQAVLAAPWWEWDPEALVRAAGLSVQDFTHLRAEQRAFAPFHRAVEVSHTIDLRRGFDDYVKGRKEHGPRLPQASSGLPHQTLERARRLERRHGPLRFTMHDPDPAMLRRLIAWKSAQYERTGVPDVFARRWTVDLLERIHAARSPHFAGVLSTLSVGGTTVAAHMGMRSASVLHWWFPAYDIAHAKLSPGAILLMETCRHAACAGIRTVELGAGAEPYKLLVADGGIEVAAAFVGSASPPFWYRHARYAVEAFAARLPIGPAARLPGKLFRRLDMAVQFR